MWLRISRRRWIGGGAGWVGWAGWAGWAGGARVAARWGKLRGKRQCRLNENDLSLEEFKTGWKTFLRLGCHPRVSRDLKRGLGEIKSKRQSIKIR